MCNRKAKKKNEVEMNRQDISKAYTYLKNFLGID